MKALTGIALFAVVSSGTVAGRDDSAALQIDNARIAHEADAKRIAFDAYVKKMHGEIMATEAAHDIAAIVLGYDVPDFARAGARIWEIRVKTIEGGLRAVIWVNPKSQQLRFVCGAWDSRKAE